MLPPKGLCSGAAQPRRPRCTHHRRKPSYYLSDTCPASSSDFSSTSGSLTVRHGAYKKIYRGKGSGQTKEKYIKSERLHRKPQESSKIFRIFSRILRNHSAAQCG